MKKLVLAVFLLLIVVVVVYLRFWHTSERVENAYLAGRSEAQTELADFQTRLDSLRYLVARQENMMGDSFSIERNDYLCTIDSLMAILDSVVGADRTGGEGEPLAPEGLAKTEPPATEQGESVAAVPSSTSVESPPFDTARATAVMAHYRRLEADLPTDLSRYERKVASYEISVETAREFSMSLAEFKAIREMLAVSE